MLVVIDVFNDIQADDGVKPAGDLRKGFRFGNVGQGDVEIGPVMGKPPKGI